MAVQRTLLNFGRMLLIASVLFYFSYHMVSGEKGVLAMMQLEQKLDAAKHELAAVSADRAVLEKRVNLMYTDSMDADLLDEQTRKMLGRVGEGEIVYMLPATDSAVR